MSTESLMQYIGEAKSRGVSDDAIRTTLLYTSWTEEEIKDAFRKYGDSREPYNSGESPEKGNKRERTVNFTSEGRPAAAKIKRKFSPAIIISVLVLIACAAAAVVWYIGYYNNAFVPATEVPLWSPPRDLN